ncbi:helix-turn-helix domain-containing protein [Acidovorax sp. SUPP2539]|uniref:helix-turn-helix domain-containing protein n=1 Tax=Acidovorax sp. SUPP2539 TaxID=2920878 RepID=UPI0023DE401B|nr:helix-turn-helix domain-containing protein [Acidovorax sp. SUPP2539]GKS90568.1 helix-turn-helix domain-containing protein [Acidovorax sp. SUPP2539]
MANEIRPASDSHPPRRHAALASPHVPGTLVEVSTDPIPSGERLDFWRESVLSRMRPESDAPDGAAFGGRLRRIVGHGADLVEHASEAVHAVRTEAMCRRDGADDISLSLMVECDWATQENHGAQQISAGMLYLVDYARPVEIRRSRHRDMSLIVSRKTIHDTLGPGFALPDQLPQRPGLGSVLQTLMAATWREAPRMGIDERTVALKACTDMALALLQTSQKAGLQADAGRFDDSLYRAAWGLVRRHCGDPAFGAERLALLLECSRASLYRLFARHGEGVAAAIWSARLEAAWQQITATAGAGTERPSLSEIALRCGFSDPSTFQRMFKRRFGLSPREARHQAN